MDINDAIKAVGTQEKLAEILGITRQAVVRWKKVGYPSPDKCIPIEKATGGKVTRYDLRPDIFGDP